MQFFKRGVISNSKRLNTYGVETPPPKKQQKTKKGVFSFIVLITPPKSLTSQKS